MKHCVMCGALQSEIRTAWRGRRMPEKEKRITGGSYNRPTGGRTSIGLRPPVGIILFYCLFFVVLITLPEYKLCRSLTILIMNTRNRRRYQERYNLIDSDMLACGNKPALTCPDKKPICPNKGPISFYK
jgi:hypothetical protein